MSLSNPLRSMRAENPRTGPAMLWSLAGSLGDGGIRFVSNLILTRLLFPEIFGLMASAMTVLTLLQIFSDTGTSTALIQNPKGNRREYIDTAFIIRLARNALLLLLITASARPVAAFYGSSQLIPMLHIMSLSLIFEAFLNPALPLMIRDLRIQRQVLYSLGSQLAAFLFGLIPVMLFRSAESLAFTYVLSSVFRLIFSYFVVSYRPALRWDREAGRVLFDFGRFILLNTALTWAVVNLDRVLLARMVGMEAAGLYHIAIYLGTFIPALFVKVFSQSWFPVISARSSDPQELYKSYSAAVRSLILPVLPILILVALFSSSIVDLLYDSRYAAAGPILFWLAVRAVLDVVQYLQSGTVLAMGKPSYISAANAVGLLIAVLLMPPMTTLYGPAGTAAAGIFSSLAVSAVLSGFMIRSLAFRPRLIALPWLYTLTAALLFTAVYSLSSSALPGSTLSSLLHFAAVALVGSALLLLLRLSLIRFISNRKEFSL